MKNVPVFRLLLLIILIVIATKVGVFDKLKKTIQLPIATPTTQVTPFNRLESFQKAKDKVYSHLPYETEGIKIEILPKSETIMVTIEADTLREYRNRKLDAENYLSGFGVNLCDLYLRWFPKVDFKQELSGEDTVTTGCPPQ